MHRLPQNLLQSHDKSKQKVKENQLREDISGYSYYRPCNIKKKGRGGPLSILRQTCYEGSEKIYWNPLNNHRWLSIYDWELMVKPLWLSRSHSSDTCSRSQRHRQYRFTWRGRRDNLSVVSSIWLESVTRLSQGDDDGDGGGGGGDGGGDVVGDGSDSDSCIGIFSFEFVWWPEDIYCRVLPNGGQTSADLEQPDMASLPINNHNHLH